MQYMYTNRSPVIVNEAIAHYHMATDSSQVGSFSFCALIVQEPTAIFKILHTFMFFGFKHVLESRFCISHILLVLPTGFLVVWGEV